MLTYLILIPFLGPEGGTTPVDDTPLGPPAGCARLWPTQNQPFRRQTHGASHWRPLGGFRPPYHPEAP